MKPLAICTTATGSEVYTNYACNLINSLRHNFPAHEVLLFTDKKLPVNAIYIDHPDLGWPRASLMRYHYLLKQEERLREYRMIIYMDADMLPVTRVSMEELETDGLLAVLHPGFPLNAFCRNPESTSCVEGESSYFQGCLQGGATGPFLEMCRTLAANIDKDDAKGVLASNYDESHLNRYLIDHPPTRILSGAFAFPGAMYIRNDRAWPRMRGVQPRIRHIDKGMTDRVW